MALVLPVGTTGCDTKPKLTEVEVPDEGVALRYDLSAGQAYAGKLRVSTTIQTPVGDIITKYEFAVDLQMTGKSTEKGRVVRATVRDITMDIRVPEGVPSEAVGTNQEMVSSLNGMEIPFELNERGEVSNEPEPPEGIAPAMQAAIATLTGALVASFAVRVPAKPIKDGESWDATNPELDEEVKSASSKGTLSGLARNEAGEDVVTLAFEGASESERKNGEQVLAINQKSSTEVLFSSSGGYPIEIERKINSEIVGQGSLYVEMKAEWTKGPKADVQEVAPTPAADPADGAEVQEITDPCDPDYVGGEECPDDAMPAEEAAGDAAGEAVP